MSDGRQKMNIAIKEFVVPLLREKSFKGSMPHFRREKDGFIDILSFQFSQWGGKFCIELGKFSNKGIKNYLGDFTPAEKVKIYNLDFPRQRLSQTMKGDYWFEYEEKSVVGNIFNKRALEVLALINNQAETWWSKRENINKFSIK